MTYSTLFGIVYCFGVAALMVASVLVIRERRRRSLPLAIAGFAWLYAANMVATISTRDRYMSREVFSVGSSDIIQWFFGLFLFTYLGFACYQFYRQMRPRTKTATGQQ